MPCVKNKDAEIVELILIVKKLDKEGLALLRSNAETLARYEELKEQKQPVCIL